MNCWQGVRESLQVLELALDLDNHWRTLLGTCMSYTLEPRLGIKEVFREFEGMTMKKDRTLMQTICWKQEKTREEEWSIDLCYLLLASYCNLRDHPLADLANPRGYTRDHGEYRLAWMLYGTLRQLLNAKGSCSHDVEQLKRQWKDDPSTFARLTAHMIAELETTGHWHWAILVWLLSRDLYPAAVIVKGVEAILLRNIQDVILEEEANEGGSAKGNVLLSKLRLPEQIVNKAKGMYYRYKGQWTRAIKCFEEAEEWALTHTLLWEHVAPCIVINKGLSFNAFTLSKMLLSKLEVHSSKIPDWAYRGAVLHKYLSLSDHRKTSSVRLLVHTH